MFLEIIIGNFDIVIINKHLMLIQNTIQIYLSRWLPNLFKITAQITHFEFIQIKWKIKK